MFINTVVLISNKTRIVSAIIIPRVGFPTLADKISWNSLLLLQYRQEIFMVLYKASYFSTETTASSDVLPEIALFNKNAIISYVLSTILHSQYQKQLCFEKMLRLQEQSVFVIKDQLWLCWVRCMYIVFSSL